MRNDLFKTKASSLYMLKVTDIMSSEQNVVLVVVL